MEPAKKKSITVQVVVNAPREVVWERWTTPKDIVHWNNASDDWHTPSAKNDLRAGGQFLYRMESRDGKFGFDFGGVYDHVKQYESIRYTMEDGRKVEILFASMRTGTSIVETFEAESQNPPELQRDGWQAILNNFKKHVEGKS